MDLLSDAKGTEHKILRFVESRGISVVYSWVLASLSEESKAKALSLLSLSAFDLIIYLLVFSTVAAAFAFSAVALEVEDG